MLFQLKLEAMNWSEDNPVASYLLPKTITVTPLALEAAFNKWGGWDGLNLDIIRREAQPIAALHGFTLEVNAPPMVMMMLIASNMSDE